MSSLSVSDSVFGNSTPAAPMAQAPAAGTAVDHRAVPLGRHPLGPVSSGPDLVLQNSSPAAMTPGSAFNGIGITTGYGIQYIPPDTTGAAGDTQYVQMVNVSYAVLNKKTGQFCQNVNWSAICSSTPYFIQLSNLFKAAASFDQTNPCANRDDGDGIVQFDRMAHRWILSQFAVPSGGPYYHCVAVSQTADATGSYYVYAFPQALSQDQCVAGRLLCNFQHVQRRAF